ncbi:MAG: transporter substrate-binding domain-containing protein [Dehalococcoidia bacterium]|nr:transporter substrate-binding domain-containing protein [Dehalococcoidia bacterium]MDD5648015.1 transporter substrate-binding domain-containing protein [Dehalococcoidia bacterium]
MKILAGILLAALIVFSGNNCAAPDGKLRIITEDYPPYNFADERGNITGQSTEIVRSLMSKTGTDTAIELMPWSKGYEIVQSQPNTMIYSTGRMPFREEMFKWVGPIGFADQWFYAKRGSNILISSLDDAKKVKSIAVYKDDTNQLFLMEKGFTNLDVSENDAQCIKKLMDGKVDLWLGPSQGLAFITYEAGVNPAEIEPVSYVRRTEWYIAFNRQTPDATIEAWQKALDDMKKSESPDVCSVYDSIITSYVLPRYTTDSVSSEVVIQLVEKTAGDIAADTAGTFRKINAGESPYQDKDRPDLYVYVFDKYVTEVANASNPAVVGRNLKGVPDMVGKLFRDAIVEGALKNGTGWEDYVFTMPGKIGLFYKSVYYKLVTGSDGKQYVVCVGRYKDKQE